MSKRTSKVDRHRGVDFWRWQPAAVAANLRRVMERDGLSVADVAAAAGLDKRTVRAISRGSNNSHAQTIHKLAGGLDVSVDTLLQPDSSNSPPFDRQTDALVDRFVAQHQDSFAAWSHADFDELYLRLGTGHRLTEAGILAAASRINAERELRRRVNIILESGEAELCTMIVKFLYGRVMARKLEAIR